MNPDGSFKEDFLYPPKNPNDNLEVEPGPGNVGFAPQGRLGDDSNGGSFNEWVAKYKRK